MIIPGLVSATFKTLCAERVIENAVKAHLFALEWSENAHVRSGGGSDAIVLKQRCADVGIQTVSYGSYYKLGQGHDIEPSLESAAVLGSPVIRIWAGVLPSFSVPPVEFDLLVREARQAAEKASSYGIKAAFEYHRNTLTDTNESAVKLLKQAAHQNLYSYWQPNPDMDEGQHSAGIDMLEDRLLNLHVFYWEQGKRRPLDEGKKQWMTYLSHVSSDANRYALLEFVMNDSEDQFFRDAQALHELLAASSL